MHLPTRVILLHGQLVQLQALALVHMDCLHTLCYPPLLLHDCYTLQMMTQADVPPCPS